MQDFSDMNSAWYMNDLLAEKKQKLTLFDLKSLLLMMKFFDHKKSGSLICHLTGSVKAGPVDCFWPACRSNN